MSVLHYLLCCSLEFRPNAGLRCLLMWRQIVLRGFAHRSLRTLESCAIVNPRSTSCPVVASCMRFDDLALQRLRAVQCISRYRPDPLGDHRRRLSRMSGDHDSSKLTHNLREGVRTHDSSSADSIASLNGRALLRNIGIPLDLHWLQEVRVNTSAVERRAQSQVARRTVKKDWQAAWLLRAISCMDLTTLSGDDTDERVRRLCAKAKHPIQHDLVEKLGIEKLGVKVGAVCVYHTFIETALNALEGSGVHVAAVSTGFPAGLSPLAERVAEIRRSVEAGAHEIDVVITRGHVFGGRWQALYDEVAAFKQACGTAHMKVILGTGDLLTLRNVARA